VAWRRARAPSRPLASNSVSRLDTAAAKALPGPPGGDRLSWGLLPPPRIICCSGDAARAGVGGECAVESQSARTASAEWGVPWGEGEGAGPRVVYQDPAAPAPCGGEEPSPRLGGVEWSLDLPGPPVSDATMRPAGDVAVGCAESHCCGDPPAGERIARGSSRWSPAAAAAAAAAEGEGARHCRCRSGRGGLRRGGVRGVIPAAACRARGSRAAAAVGAAASTCCKRRDSCCGVGTGGLAAKRGSRSRGRTAGSGWVAVPERCRPPPRLLPLQQSHGRRRMPGAWHRWMRQVTRAGGGRGRLGTPDRGFTTRADCSAAARTRARSSGSEAPLAGAGAAAGGGGGRGAAG